MGRGWCAKQSRGGQGNQGRAAIKKTCDYIVLKQTLDAITDEGMKIRTTSRAFGIPPTSLRDHLFGTVLGRRRGPKTVLTENEENKLVDYCFKMQELGHHSIPMQLKLKVAQATQTRDTPWSDIGMPGKTWLKSFRQRHLELVARKSQPLELDRARGLCPNTLAILYCNLKYLYNTFNYPVGHIWNCDEYGVQDGRSGGVTVLAKLGSKLVHNIEPDQKKNTYHFYHASMLKGEKFLTFTS